MRGRPMSTAARSTGSNRPQLGALLVAVLVVATGCKRAASKQEEPVKPELARGHELYGRMCSVCHGARGEGYAADFAPRLAQANYLASVSDEFLRIAIRDGRDGTPMSAWGRQHGGPLDEAEISDVVRYLRSFHSGPKAALNEGPITGNPQRGEELFAQRCKLCHGDRGGTGPNVRIGNPQLLASASDGFLRYAIQRGRPGTAMPAFEQSLGAAGIEDILAALRAWQTPPAPPPPAAAAPLPLGPVPLNPKGPDPQGFKANTERTSATVIKAQLDRGARMAILDARAPSDYLRQHITGAVSVPFYDPSPYLSLLPKDTWMVCYCGCPHAESGKLAERLVAAGFKKVTVLDEGLGFWASNKYGVSTDVAKPAPPTKPHP